MGKHDSDDSHRFDQRPWGSFTVLDEADGFNDREVLVEAGQAIDIAIGAAHRVENRGGETLVFIEVQRGDYLGEDDILRLQDDFGRAAGSEE